MSGGVSVDQEIGKRLALGVMGPRDLSCGLFIILGDKRFGHRRAKIGGSEETMAEGARGATANGKRPGTTDMRNGRSRGRMSGKDGHRES